MNNRKRKKMHESTAWDKRVSDGMGEFGTLCLNWNYSTRRFGITSKVMDRQRKKTLRKLLWRSVKDQAPSIGKQLSSDLDAALSYPKTSPETPGDYTEWIMNRDYVLRNAISLLDSKLADAKLEFINIETKLSGVQPNPKEIDLRSIQSTKGESNDTSTN